MKNEYAGSYVAGLFIARLIKQVYQRKNRHKVNEVQHIGQFNAKVEYSRKLRELEASRKEKKKIMDEQKKSLSMKKIETEMDLLIENKYTTK